MLWHRMRGLNRAYYSVLVIFVSGFYWLYLLLFGSLVQRPLDFAYEWYVTYCLAAICTFAVRALNSGTKGEQLLRSDFYSNHSAALRDVSAAGAAILLVLVATKDLRISRLFLFSFLPLLYIVLFFCHRFLPTTLVRIFFFNGHMEKTLLVGPIEKAERIENWYSQMSNLGLEASCFFEGFGGNGEPSYGLNPLGLTNLERIVPRKRIYQAGALGSQRKHPKVSEDAAGC